MARLFTEGFEMGDSLVLPNLTSPGSIRTDIKRTGNYGFAGRGNVAEWKHDVSLNEVYIRFGYNGDNWYDGTNTSLGSAYVRFMVGSTTLAHFNIGYDDNSGNWRASVNGSLVATSSITLSSDTWYLIEMHFKLADSGGLMELKINGVTAISYTGDTKPTADTEFDAIKFYLGGSTSGRYQYIDDLAINDTTGSEDNSWCGDGHIIAIKPNADGDNIDLTGSDEDQTDNYAMVDDIPSDGDSTYVYGDTVDNYDLYELTAPSLPVNHTITRIWPEARAKDPDTGDIALPIKSGTTQDDGTTKSLTTAYSAIKGDEYLVNPDDSEAWEESDLNDLQVGVKIK